jgi:DtxR family Mn-dependent transcriptional regulator
MENELTLSASLEDYLEAIFHISSHKQAAKAKDIAERLHVRASSVTGALRQLAERGLVNYAPYDLITLTATGRKAAESVVQRHAALRTFSSCAFCGRSQRDEAAARWSTPLPKTFGAPHSLHPVWTTVPGPAASGYTVLATYATKPETRPL